MCKRSVLVMGNLYNVCYWWSAFWATSGSVATQVSKQVPSHAKYCMRGRAWFETSSTTCLSLYMYEFCGSYAKYGTNQEQMYRQSLQSYMNSILHINVFTLLELVHSTCAITPIVTMAPRCCQYWKLNIFFLTVVQVNEPDYFQYLSERPMGDGLFYCYRWLLVCFKRGKPMG